jgi:hypothetical protein
MYMNHHQHEFSPLLSLQHSRLPNDFNPVNHPFRLSEMTENDMGMNPSRGAVCHQQLHMDFGLMTLLAYV